MNNWILLQNLMAKLLEEFTTLPEVKDIHSFPGEVQTWLEKNAKLMHHLPACLGKGLQVEEAKDQLIPACSGKELQVEEAKDPLVIDGETLASFTILILPIDSTKLMSWRLKLNNLYDVIYESGGATTYYCCTLLTALTSSINESNVPPPPVCTSASKGLQKVEVPAELFAAISQLENILTAGASSTNAAILALTQMGELLQKLFPQKSIAEILAEEPIFNIAITQLLHPNFLRHCALIHHTIIPALDTTPAPALENMRTGLLWLKHLTNEEEFLTRVEQIAAEEKEATSTLTNQKKNIEAFILNQLIPQSNLRVELRESINELAAEEKVKSSTHATAIAVRDELTHLHNQYFAGKSTTAEFEEQGMQATEKAIATFTASHENTLVTILRRIQQLIQAIGQAFKAAYHYFFPPAAAAKSTTPAGIEFNSSPPTPGRHLNRTELD